MNEREHYEADEIITLDFDDGTSVEAGILGLFEVDGVTYIALAVLSGEDMYLYRYVDLEDSFQLEDIPEKDFERVSAEFDRIMRGDA